MLLNNTSIKLIIQDVIKHLKTDVNNSDIKSNLIEVLINCGQRIAIKTTTSAQLR